MTPRSAFPATADCRTQRRLARDGIISPEMARVAEREHLAAETLERVKQIEHLTAELLLTVIEEQARQGVD
jgi:thiamine biosynthesis protein ThiC